MEVRIIAGHPRPLLRQVRIAAAIRLITGVHPLLRQVLRAVEVIITAVVRQEVPPPPRLLPLLREAVTEEVRLVVLRQEVLQIREDNF